MHRFMNFLFRFVAFSIFIAPPLLADDEVDEVLVASHYSRPVYFDGTFLFKLKRWQDDVNDALKGASLEIFRLKHGASGEDDRDWEPVTNRILIASHRQYLPTSPRRWSPYRLYIQKRSDGSKRFSFLIFNRGGRYMAFRHGRFDESHMTLSGELREGNNPRSLNSIGVYRSTTILFTPIATE